MCWFLIETNILVFEWSEYVEKWASSIHNQLKQVNWIQCKYLKTRKMGCTHWKQIDSQSNKK